MARLFVVLLLHNSREPKKNDSLPAFSYYWSEGATDLDGTVREITFVIFLRVVRRNEIGA